MPSGESYVCEGNGNQTLRNNARRGSYTLGYGAKNRLSGSDWFVLIEWFHSYPRPMKAQKRHQLDLRT